MRHHRYLPFVASNANGGDRVAGETNRDVGINGDTNACENPSKLGVVRALDFVAAELIGGAALTRATADVRYISISQKKKIFVEKNVLPRGRSSKGTSNESNNNECLGEHF